MRLAFALYFTSGGAGWGEPVFKNKKKVVKKTKKKTKHNRSMNAFEKQL